MSFYSSNYGEHTEWANAVIEIALTMKWQSLMNIFDFLLLLLFFFFFWSFIIFYVPAIWKKCLKNLINSISCSELFESIEVVGFFLDDKRNY